MIRNYTDENISRAVINGLRQRGIDVLSVPEAEMMGASVEAHLAFALEQGRIISHTMMTSYVWRLREKHMRALSIVHSNFLLVKSFAA